MRPSGGASLDRRRACVALAAVAVASTVRRVAHAALSRIAIGANPAGTNFHLLAGGFAKVLQESLGVPSIVRPYAGSSVYVPLLQRGEIALGINSSIDSFLAFAGRAPYRAPMTNLRALLSVYPLEYMYWGRASSGLERIEELRGRRVVLNYRGLVPLDLLNRAILATGGLTERDVTPVTAAGLPEGARAVVEGRADAAAMGYRLPLVAQTHATMPGGLRFLTLGADESRVAELLPGARVTTVTPGSGAVGIDAPIRTAVYDTYLNTSVHVTDEDAYRITAALVGRWEELRRDYAVLADVAADAVAPVAPPLPYHAGAIAYFREAGLWSAEHDGAQARFG